MTLRVNERVAFHNGKFLPESEILIPFRDRSFRWGDGCYDMARTFRGKPFRLEEHIKRLYRSLAYLSIELELTQDEMLNISREVVSRNEHLLSGDDDYWICQRISRGLDAVGDENWQQTGPTVIVECIPIPFKGRARFFRAGIKLQVSSFRRTPPVCLSPHAKLNNYLNHFMADIEVRRRDPDTWALFLDYNGNIAEGTSNNFFMVKDGILLTPREQFILSGITRQVVMELAKNECIELRETDIDAYDAANAQEMFLTMTSMCICPVSSFNGHPVGNGSLPGPTTERLMRAFRELVGMDYVAQFLRHQSDQG
jgi:branched-chain amino acid aminotransferase